MTVPAPTTPGDIITLALKTANVVGVGQTPEAEDMNDAFNLLNMLLAQLQRRRYFVYGLTTTSFQGNNSVSYTVGPGGNFNIPRPAKIESAFFRQNNTTSYPVDYPLEILRSQEDYNRISLKTLNAFPRYCFYDMAYPTGNLFVWPVPNNTYTIFISTITQIQQFVDVSDQIALPPEYSAALMWNLVMELYPFYGLPVNPVVVGKAEASLRIIEEANVQIPQLAMPPALKNNRGSTYNIYGDFMIGSSP
jgi:hypothetical protein